MKIHSSARERYQGNEISKISHLQNAIRGGFFVAVQQLFLLYHGKEPFKKRGTKSFSRPFFRCLIPSPPFSLLRTHRKLKFPSMFFFRKEEKAEK
jgi:hypothetical protein